MRNASALMTLNPVASKKAALSGLIETPERVRRSGKAVIDPYAIITQDAVDLTRQPARLGDQIEQECGDDAIHGAVGEGGLEGIRRGPARHAGGLADPPSSPRRVTWPASLMARGKARSSSSRRADRARP